ncbi:hypothetical protein KAFR_0F01630 [Kazachstania africana CBS 2517]|uniref:Protein kinase domain-containing protein n=1 Tax=Kazachstania africana (strain ATCC 22294 / BCRC 22015 / CBS 2517 / CECT 1963 / NBRC 1671 / NRRL Y-8276) TaxID=1071382 RepID=H2AWL0_KAZAF|nr:hypothetical protein KAFR_0F01630 [Kazachstania africana CBS 2517]CCF58760.1 hypothetical protein KAFR_0F01630 [Kazachstania africana CBS 2517]
MDNIRQKSDQDFNMVDIDDADNDMVVNLDVVNNDVQTPDKFQYQTSNNLKFYPYSNSNKLTRSVATLNLSLSNIDLPESQSKALQRIREEEDEEMNHRIHRWSPFHTDDDDDDPSTPTLKRSASKSELSPFVNNPETLKKWNYKQPPSSNLSKQWSSQNSSNKNNNANNDNIPFNRARPDPQAFQSTGLTSKIFQNNNLYPKKLLIPNTPVKQYPLKDTGRISNITTFSNTIDDSIFSEDPNNSNLTNDTLPFVLSPTLETARIRVSTGNSSPISALKSSNKSNSRSPYLNKFKKFKKLRDSVILKNEELSNSLQQFTDDLYGVDENSQSKNFINDNISFFSQLPPPTYQKGKDDFVTENSSTDEDDMSTPTRRKTIAGAKHRAADILSSSKQSPIRTRKHVASASPDLHLFERFSNVNILGQSQFSTVYQVTFDETKKRYAVKSITPNKHNSLHRILQEIGLLAEIRDSKLDEEGKEYVVDFITSWKFESSFYVMTDYYENGNLDKFLQEQVISKKARLEDWRIWKIIVEICLGLRFIHETCRIVHLDIKPSNIMVTFEGNLKLGDFGMATHLPLEDPNFENEGDREYIAPEIISKCTYDFRADIFSLGLMIVEIAANVILPDNGNAWHKLRSGDLSDAGRLSSTDIHSESLFSGATKIDTHLTELTIGKDDRNSRKNSISKIPAWVPRFLIDGESLERVVKWMIDPNYRKRPTASDLLQTEECLYVERTRKAGAIIQEDDFGPTPEFFK